MPVVTLYPEADDELARRIRKVLELHSPDVLLAKRWDVPLMRAIVAKADAAASPLRSSVHAGAGRR